MTADLRELAREIARLGRELGASHTGIADMTRACEARPESFEE